MKHIKNFKQYESKDALNEGIVDSILSYSGKLKGYFAKKLQNLGPMNDD